jgi:hypothetical protein
MQNTSTYPPGLFTSIIFSVKDPRPLNTLPGGRRNEWIADVKAVRPGLFCKEFTNIFFVEARDTASVLGMETLDGRPHNFPDDLADIQQQFIQFLREQTRIDASTLGGITDFFEGYEYSSEAAATAAYVVARDIPLHVGVGYQTESGAYELIGIHRTHPLVSDARLMLPYDELEIGS